MAIKNRSEISTIIGPEFINLQPLDLNPMMSECQIKVFYLGQNRNGSYIDRETAEDMAKTLRGTPIVAAWHEEEQDFGGHGNVMTIEDGDIKFSCSTVPYGFVSPDSEVWFQNYIDQDEFGNKIERTYLCTNGYLWTGQYPEIQKAIDEGQPHSMELDADSMEGHWSTDTHTGVEFYIINDATFSKLCILGDAIEPCFEGSSVENISDYSLSSDEFKYTLFSMMKDLEETLKNDKKGGEDMNIEEPVTEFTEVEQDIVDDTSEEVEESEDFACGGSDKKKKYADKDDDDKDDDTVDEDVKDDTDTDDDKDKKKPATKSALEVDAEALKIEFDALKAEVEELRAYRLEQENLKKDALINKYHMLSSEDKADVIAHKEEYSLADIESKLALIYVQKNVDFSTIDGQEEDMTEEEPVSSFSLDDDVEFVPPAVAALREVKSRNFF